RATRSDGRDRGSVRRGEPGRLRALGQPGYLALRRGRLRLRLRLRRRRPRLPQGHRCRAGAAARGLTRFGDVPCARLDRAAGARHGGYFLSSSPAVLLSAISERTNRVRLLTGVTVLSILDPVRVAEEFATLDNLSDGRVELIVSKGNHPDQYSLFGLDEALQW